MKLSSDTFYDLLVNTPNDKVDLSAINYDGKELSFKSLRNAVDLCCKDLADIGVKKGDHVALWAFNSLNWVVTFLAINRIGGVAVLMNYGLAIEDVEELMSFTDVKYIVYGSNSKLKIDENVASALARKLELASTPIDINSQRYDYAERTITEAPSPIPCCKYDSKETTVIIFTTGTTSKPKAVQLSQFGILNNAYDALEMMNKYQNDKMCIALPLFHSYGLVTLIAYLSSYKTVYLPTDLRPNVIIELLDKYSITDLTSVGIIYLGLVSNPKFDKIAALLKMCLVGGGFTTPVQMMRLDMAFVNAKFLCGYGQTEASPIISLENGDDSIEKRAYTVGKPLPNIDLRILDTSKGFLPYGKVGEVVLKGYNLMNGYYKLPPEKQAVDSDGWLHTGDLGYIDEEGYLHLSGRIKDIIIKNGENLSPSDIESEIIKYDAVREVKVLGAPHPIFGESVEACLTLDSTKAYDEDALRKMLLANMTAYKVPSHFFIYDVFPLNANGKLNQRALRTDMLDKLLEMSIRDSLHAGFIVADVTIKNTTYNVVPVTAMIEALTKYLGFTQDASGKICLATEEMLLERIVNAYSDVGDIHIQVVLRDEWLSIRFKDQGAQYFIEKNTSSSYSAMIILKTADSFKTEYAEDGHPIYCMDFLYNKNFNIQNFLKEQSKEVVSMLK
ncbi:MAG: AMP-binding protein [Clostridia bacterium]|nr:AMP-binding protein [Clostridia bacterium]